MLTPFHSIRWRLPLSYAAIALFTALVLGAVLLAILRGYYGQREHVYLENRAQLIGAIMTPLVAEQRMPTVLAEQVKGLAFLAQVRVQLVDTQERVLADSGSPSGRAAFSLPAPPLSSAADEVKLLIRTEAITREIGILGTGAPITDRVNFSFTVPQQSAIDLPPVELDFVFDAPMPDLFFRGDFAGDFDQEVDRSARVVRQRLTGTQGQLLGYVQLSEGPAYGQQIVAGAAMGLVAAAAIAILLAALVGLAISRQLTAPLAQLTVVTAQMATGDLSARTDIVRNDELGILAQSFNEMAQRVEDTVYALRRFVADAAHELNTPITALRTNLELEPPSRLGAHRLEQILRLETLVQNLLLLSRLDAASRTPGGEQAQGYTALDLTTLVSHVCEPYASHAEQRDITFVLDIPVMAVEISGTQSLLTQALTNLLDNALKFCEPGGIVRVHLWRTDAAIHLAVEDSGIGVPAAEMPLLFNRFYRASDAAAYAGNGLGLAIVKAIIEQHGGRVWAEKLTSGMRFVIVFDA